ncbi:MAG: hypothetical protein B6D65_04355 [candidate division Zixibacteria bacterium 4484_93]|nr:MAG: hypothetical protein B6D65_04355 [candidate division Zixibacteria bacterium 4484_93]RKZ33961.1 MAG: hypothetical protein DRQ19_01930 [bacterium]
MYRRRGRPEAIGDILGRILERHGLKKRVEESGAVLIWDDVVGEQVSKHTTPVKIERGVLFIHCESASWRQEISFLKSDLIKKLNKHLGKKLIKDIVIG